MTNMVVVTGATGLIGSRVVRELGDRGIPARALVRDRARAVRALGEGIDLAQGDFADAASLRRAFDGAESVFLACGNDARQVEFEINAIDAAVAAGVRRIVKLSAKCAGIDAPFAPWVWHGQIEQYLQASGVPAVILQPAFSMANLLIWAATIKQTGRLFAPAGNAKIAMIDPGDVAAAAAVALTEDGHDGKTYQLTGPEAITYERVAAYLSAATGQTIQFVDVPDEAAPGALVQAGVPDWMAAQIVTLFGELKRGVYAQTTDSVRVLTGRDPRDFSGFAAAHAGLFAG